VLFFVKELNGISDVILLGAFRTFSRIWQQSRISCKVIDRSYQLSGAVNDLGCRFSADVLILDG
jgi:hypothetical protein